jgi:hypothetical protein
MLASGIAALQPAPKPLREPAQELGLFRPPVLVTRSDAGYEVIPFERRGAVKPLWSVNPVVKEECTSTRHLGWNCEGPSFGFFRVTCRWTYQLMAIPFDGENNGPETVLPDADTQKLRPLVAEELNRRSGARQLGAELTTLLDKGARKESSLCPQNLVVLAAWLLVLQGVLAALRVIIAKGRQKEASATIGK